jgi:Domain of unknown function (DUF4328)
MNFLSTPPPVSRSNFNVPFASGRTRARLVIWLLMAGIVVDILATISGFFQISFLSDWVAGAEITEDEVFWNDLRQVAIALPKLFIYLTTVVLFSMWIHRAYRNLPALGASRLEYTPGWAVGWFFVPFANLFYPYRVVKEIWIKSDPEVDDTEASLWQSASAPPLLAWWWAAWIISNIVDNAIFRLNADAEKPAALLLLAQAELAANALDATAALLALFVVRGIDRRQEERSKRFTLVNSPPPPPVFERTSEAQST